MPLPFKPEYSNASTRYCFTADKRAGMVDVWWTVVVFSGGGVSQHGGNDNSFVSLFIILCTKDRLFYHGRSTQGLVGSSLVRFDIRNNKLCYWIYASFAQPWNIDIYFSF